MTTVTSDTANGSALAAFLGAGIGAFAMGGLCILHESGLFVAPSIYAPAGGLSGRVAIACLIWLVAWGGLHQRWNRRQRRAPGVFLATGILLGLGLLGTFPPVWGLL
jgi:hypothetical protein